MPRLKPMSKEPMIGRHLSVIVKASAPSYLKLIRTTLVNVARNEMNSSAQLIDSFFLSFHLPKFVWLDMILTKIGARIVIETREITGFAVCRLIITMNTPKAMATADPNVIERYSYLTSM